MMICFICKKKSLAAGICLACLALLALPAAAQEGYVEIGEDSTGTWSLYLPSVEERAYSKFDRTRYVAGWVQVIYKKDEVKESEDVNIEELAQGNEDLAQALAFLIGLGKMLERDDRHRGMFLYAANKEMRQIQRISALYYDEEGDEVSRKDGSFNQFLWKECPPGSIDEKIWQALMEASRNR